MQPGQDTLDITPPPAAPARRPPAEEPRSPYVPRTVWQTPHGLAPTLTRQRTTRNSDISQIMRRSLRLVYRLRRVAEYPGSFAGLAADGHSNDCLSLAFSREAS